MVRLEELSKLKEFYDLNGTRTRNLPACSIAPQPSTVPLLCVIFYQERFIVIRISLKFVPVKRCAQFAISGVQIGRDNFCKKRVTCSIVTVSVICRHDWHIHYC
jgi:hypothetical protein